MPSPQQPVEAVAPATMTFRVCPVCGRTDRFSHLNDGAGRHRTNEGKCPGAPEKVVYQPALVAERLAQQLEQWEPVALALVEGHPVRNLDELIAGSRLALEAYEGKGY